MKIVALLLASMALASTGCGAESIEQRWFNQVDGYRIKGQFIDLSTTGSEKLYTRYSQIADSGIELERTTNNVVSWRVHVQPLGVEHSLYKQDVSVWIESEKVWVVSKGARTIYEIRALTTGKLMSRKIEDAQK